MPIESSGSRFDAIVVGGSYAGVSAALQLARARRRVLVVDAGQRRNRFAAHAHGFLAQDGRAPGAIAADARAQLLAYPTVQWCDATATRAAADEAGFVVHTDAGGAERAAKLVLAIGVRDELPRVEGLQERWGRSVFHCPYCHGYELDEGRIGVLAVGPMSLHQAMMLPHWGRVTLFANEALDLDAEQSAELSARGVTVESGRVARVTGHATVELQDGRSVELDGLFVASRTHPSSDIAAQLGCEFDESPLGVYVRTDGLKATTVPGVFACGDAARAAGNVAFAVGDGAQAGASVHRSLLFD